MKYLMGIDLGSTSLKAVIFDLEGNVRAISSRPTLKNQQSTEHPDWIVWEPENIWSGTADAIKEAIQQLDNPDDIAAVAVTGMGMDGVPIDENGKWLYPFISWHDPRTIPQHQWWLDNVGVDAIFNVTGREPMHICSINRMMWVKEHEPEVYAKTYKWLLIEDFINYMLCEQCATDYSMAATTQVFDCFNLEWSEELIEKSGVNRNIFPEPKPSGTLLGEVTQKAASRTGLKQGTPVVLGGHDYTCGALACGGGDSESLINITGTWEMLIASASNADRQKEVHKGGLFWDPHVVVNSHLLICHSVSGSMIEWFRSELGQAEQVLADKENTSVWDILMKKAEKVNPGSDGLLFLPHLSGSNCPVVDPKSKGAFLGIKTTTEKSMFIRALIEGLNYQSRQMIEEIQQSGIKIKNVIAIGGATKNRLWMQNRSDVLGMPLEVPDIEGATCLGVAMVAGIGVGLYSDEKEAFEKVYKQGRVFNSDAQRHKQYDKVYNHIFKKLYGTLKQVNHDISNIF